MHKKTKKEGNRVKAINSNALRHDASVIYNVARRLGANHSTAKAFLPVIYNETTPYSKHVVGDSFDYRTTQYAAGDNDDRVLNYGYFSLENLRPTTKAERAARRAAGEQYINYVEDPNMPLGKYKQWLTDNSLIDSPEAQIGYMLTQYRHKGKNGVMLKDLNKKSGREVTKLLMQRQRAGHKGAIKDALENYDALDKFKAIKDVYGETDIERELGSYEPSFWDSVFACGGKTRKYDTGGYIGFRDKFGDIQGNSYGIEKGIQGQAVKEGAMTGLSTGLTTGLLGSQFIGTGAATAGTAAATTAATAGTTAAAGAGASAAGGAAAAGGGTLLGMSLGTAIPVIGTVLGAIGGAIAGIFTGKKRRDRAKARAIEQDRQRKLIAANNRILEDEMSLDNKTFNSGSLSLQADSIDNINTPENPTYMSNTIQSKSPFSNSPFVGRCGGKTKRYVCGGRTRKYDGGGQIQQVASNAQIVNGPSHEQGGVQYSPQAEVEGGEAILTDANSAYVFSDELEYNGRTFADIAKPLMKHKGYLEEQLQMQGLLLGKALQMTDRSTYSIDRNTNSRNAEKLNMQMEETRAQVMQLQQMLNQLYNTQEQMKAEQGGMAEPKTTFAFGGQFGLNYMPTNIGLGATNTQMNPMLSNEEEEQTETNETSVPMSPVMRCGGRTRKYAGGGFAPYAGLAVEAGGNLIAGLMQHFGNKASVNAMDKLANSNLFDTPHIPSTNLEWDVNTDATLGNILRETRGYERFVRDNTSNSQVARQAVLNARIKGAIARAGVKQNEHNTELTTRNQIRQINNEIATKNRMIDAENANRRYQNMVDSIVARSQNMSGLASTLTQLGRAVGTGYQTKFDLDNIQMTNLISLLGNDKSRDYIMNALGAAGMSKYFGKAGLSAFNARTAKTTEPFVTTAITPVAPSVYIPRTMRMKGI